MGLSTRSPSLGSDGGSDGEIIVRVGYTVRSGLLVPQPWEGGEGRATLRVQEALGPRYGEGVRGRVLRAGQRQHSRGHPGATAGSQGADPRASRERCEGPG